MPRPLPSDAWPRARLNPTGAKRREQPDLARTEYCAGGKHHVAGFDVVCTWPDGPPDGAACVDDDASVAAVRRFNRHYAVSTMRNWRSGHDLDGGVGTDREWSSRAGRNLTDNRQRDGVGFCRLNDVLGPDRIAIHRRVVEARQIDGANEVLVNRQPERLNQRLIIGLQRADTAQDPLEMLLNAEHVIGDRSCPWARRLRLRR